MDEDTIKEMKELFKIMLADEEFFALQAQVTARAILAMEAEGFTRTEAIACIAKK